jgi:hypothetical protein
LALNGVIRICLRGKRFTQQMQKELESVPIELPKIRQTLGLAIRKPRASGLNFTIFLRQLRFKPLALGLAILHAR